MAMQEIANTLCDARSAVQNALAAMEPGIPFTLRSGFFRAQAAGDLVVWREWANRSTDCPVVDELLFEVQILAQDTDRLRTLCDGVNAALLELGLRRVYSSPDAFDADSGRCTKTFRFGRKVDKRWMRLMD
jgi:hypothetical protein